MIFNDFKQHESEIRHSTGLVTKGNHYLSSYAERVIGKKIDRCPVCASLVTPLGVRVEHAPVSHVVRATHVITPESFESIAIGWCSTCDHYLNIAAKSSVAPESNGFLTNSAVSPGMRTRHRRLCEYINPIIGKQGSVLDVGAGSGGYTIAFASSGHKVVAVEPNLSVPAMDDRVEVLHDSWPTAQLKGRRFDVILCVQVLEHIVQPVEAVRQMLEHLTVGGLLYLEIPSGDWVLNHSAITDIHFPHRNYFTASSIQRLVNDLNFEITHTRNLENRDIGYVIQDRRRASETKPTSWAAFPRHQGLLKAAEILQSRLTTFKSCTALYGANANTQALLGWYPDIMSDVILDDTPEYWGHYAYSLTQKIPVVKPSAQNLKGLEHIIIASYMHDREISLKVRELGFTGDVVSLRPPTAVVDGPLSLFT